jgi:hypothetical protein
MKVLVVYESLWGNTAAVARAIAEGVGPQAQVLATGEATVEALAGADLIVAGAPLHAFGLPRESRRKSIVTTPGKAPAPDFSNPTLHSWLEALPPGQGRVAAFETRFKGSPGGATGGILRRLERKGYRRIAKGQRFLIKGTYGPLREGEIERARQWGVELAKAIA